VARFSGRRFFLLKRLLLKPGIFPVVIARPQHVAVAISILQTVEIASLSLRDALGAPAMTKLLIVIPA